MKIIKQSEPITVIGIELRTSNDVAMQTIPPFWQRFYEEKIIEKIPNKISDDVYGVYTNFQHQGHNNEGIYSFIIGVAVSSSDDVPDGLVTTTIPASQRAVFYVEPGHPEKIGETWLAIWKRTDLKKTFISEYEHYAANGEIAVYVGIEENIK